MPVALTDPTLAGPCLFWYWNATPTPEQIDQQVAEMAAAGFQGIYVHPMPQSFRPAEFNGGMELDYLSPAFFELIAHACQAIKRHNMIMWLYDEGGWPSGRAGGLVVAEDPAYGIWLVEQRDGRVLRRQMTDGCTYPDLMNPLATDCFIRLTHERYKAAIGHEFGRTVRGMFTDEARLLGSVGSSQMPWSPRLPEEFQSDHGYALEPVLGHLFAPAAADSVERKTQRDYVSTMSRLNARNYYERIERWCHESGLLFEGHHSGEDSFARHGQFFGDYLQQARHYHIPGVDTIWRQLFPGQPGGNFTQLASSAAWRKGSRIALSESFGVYGPGLTLAQMKWVTAFQAVRGISKIGVMAYYLSTDGARWLGICSEMSGRTPVWSHIDLWTAYLRRVAEFVCRGDAVVAVGVYYRSELVRTEDEDAFNRQHEQLCDRIGDQLVGWAFVGFDDLTEATIETGSVRTGALRFRAIVVHLDGPPTADEHHLFDRLAASGVRVSVVSGDRDAWPPGVEVVDSLHQLNLKAWCSVEVDRELAGVRMLELQDGDWHGGLLFNQNDVEVAFNITLASGDRTLIPFSLEPDAVGLTEALPIRSGATIHLRPHELRAFEIIRKNVPPVMGLRPTTPSPVRGPWRMRPDESFTITNDVERSRDRSTPQPCELGDLGERLPDFSGSVVYSTQFSAQPARPGERVLLDLGDVRHAADVYVNGILAGRRAWSPYVFDLTPNLRDGENELEVRVTGTLARAWRAAVSGMNPAWRTMYVDKVESWAAGESSFGLIGPVVMTRYREDRHGE